MKDSYKERKRFFETLFGKSKGYIEIRSINKKGEVKQDWYETSEIDRMLFELDKPYFKRVNTYFGVCPRREKKGKEENVCQVNCLWMDLDAKSPHEKEAVKKRLDDFDPEASIIVSSGHGYHCYWLFENLEELKSNKGITVQEDIDRLKGYNKGLAQELRADKGIDLSRVLRVPGTKNLKDPKETLAVTVIKFEPQIRYSLKGQFLKRFKRDIGNNEIEKIEFDQDSASNIPDRFWKVLEENSKIKATWKGERKDLKDNTRSGYDMALSNLLMPFEFSNSELVSILRESESGKGREAKAQYLVVTIGKAKAAFKRRKKEKEKSLDEDRERFLSLEKEIPKEKAPPISTATEEKKKSSLKPIGLEELLDTFKKWLELEETEYIEVMLATIISNQILGDPVWLFIIGAPGASKTEILRSFKDIESIYTTSKLTAQTLISGKIFKNYDPSLLPKLDGKTLILKDFTTMLSLRAEDKQIIFSDLREAYDGYLEKNFGNIGKRSYSAHFTVIAGVTPVLDRYSTVQQCLGERFLKLRLSEKEAESKIKKAVNNLDVQTTMREELSTAAQRFFAQEFKLKDIQLSEEVKDNIVKLAQYTATLRTTVSRNPYNRDIIEYIPEEEIGTRIGIQLAKLGKSLAAIRGKKEITQSELKTLYRVAKDSIPKKVRIFVDCLMNQPYRLTTSEITEITGIEVETCRYALKDLQVLKLVNGKTIKGKGNPIAWKVTKKFENLNIAL